jgi:hypothetical protein
MSAWGTALSGLKQQQLSEAGIAVDESVVDSVEEAANAKMWAVTGDAYFPCEKTEEKLAPGQYIVQYSEAKGFYFLKKKVNLDDLINLPDSQSQHVLDSIAHFWTKEKSFRKHGFLWKRGMMIWGPPGCLDASTKIAYSSFGPDGNRRSHKGGNIERLYQVFHGITGPGKGRYQKAPSDSIFYVSSVNDEGQVFKNRILNVVKSGSKECFELTTKSGYKIRTTADHKFFTGDNYISLKDLKIGSTVMIHNNTVAYKHKHKHESIIGNRKYLYLKNHPIAGTKVIDKKYVYKKVALSRAIMEAHMNHFSVVEYVHRLNSGTYENMSFLRRNQNVHHIDENFTNDDLSNLEIVDQAVHSKWHGTGTLNYVAVEDIVKSIVSVGYKETYDICMESPYNNFVADKFVVHNSGKTCTLQQLSKMIIDRGGFSVYVNTDPEFVATGLSIMRRIEPDRPIIVMIEDIDAIIQRHGEASLLALLDGELQIDNVVFIATTNYPEQLDARFVNRPSRFDEIIYIGMPSEKAREVFLKKKNKRISTDKTELAKWVKATDGWSIAHMRELIVAVECLDNPFDETVERLKEMNEIKPNSENSNDRPAFGFGPRKDD